MVGVVSSNDTSYIIVWCASPLHREEPNIAIPTLSRCPECGQTNKITVWSSTYNNYNVCTIGVKRETRSQLRLHRWLTSFHPFKRLDKFPWSQSKSYSFAVLSARTRCVHLPTHRVWQVLLPCPCLCLQPLGSPLRSPTTSFVITVSPWSGQEAG